MADTVDASRQGEGRPSPGHRCHELSDARLNWEEETFRELLSTHFRISARLSSVMLAKVIGDMFKKGGAAEDRFVDVLTECENAVEGPVLTEMRP